MHEQARGQDSVVRRRARRRGSTAGAASGAGHEQEVELRERVTNALCEALRPHMRRAPPEVLDVAVESIAAALREQFKIITRRARPRLETARALAMRLPDVGVEVAVTKRERQFAVRVVGEHQVEVELDGDRQRFSSLKAAATAICGYPPSVGGWQFFFGAMTREEVAERYGTERKG